MSIVVENQNLFHWYSRGAYQKIIAAVHKKNNYRLQDILLMGLSYFKMQEFMQSRQCMDFVIEHASEESPWAKHAHFLCSQLSMIEQDWEAAIVYLEELLCMKYAYEIQASNSLAFAYWQNKNVPQAIYHLERVLEQEEQNSSALNSLGFILADTEMDVPKAYDLCDHATQLKSDYSPYLDSMGWTLYKLGQRAKAIYTLRKAMILTPENAEVRRHLKDVVVTA